MDANRRHPQSAQESSRRRGAAQGHRNAATEMLDRMRHLVDTVAVALDGPLPTQKDRVVETWARIQEYYTPQRQDDLRKLRVTDTTIPHHLEAMLKLLAREMIETESSVLEQPLEFGPCIEYLLQFHVLSDLVDFADADMPRGIRKYVVLFFDAFIDGIPLGLLPESAIRLPLVAIMHQCQTIVEASPTTPVSMLRRQEQQQQPGGSEVKPHATSAAFRLGQGYHSIHNDKAAVVLCHDLLRLVVTLFRRLQAHGSLVHLFFDWTGTSSSNSSNSNSGSEQFILRVVIEYLLAPGYTGELAREALVLIVQVLLLAPESRDRQVAVLLDQARVAEMLVEHMSYLYSQVPVFRPMPRSPTARLFGSDYRGNRRLAPLDRRRRRRQRPDPAQTSSSSSCRRIRPEHPSPSDTGAAETQPAHRYYDDVKPRLQALLARESVLRSVAGQDRRELDILKSARVGLEHVDAFFLTWELIDEIAAISNGSEPRITTAVQRQLSNGFLRTHIVPALMAQMTSMSQAITTVSYLTDLVNATHSTAVLDALFAVLLGTDLSPETQTQQQKQQQNQLQLQLQLQHPAPAVGAAADAPGEGGGEDAMDVTESELSVLSTEDRALLASIEDDTLRAEAAALLLPPGSDVSRILGSAAAGSSGSTVAANGPANSSSGSADEGATAAAAGATGAERRAASEPHASLRATLIGWMTLEDNMHLSLSTMRLFDAILASMNQLAYTSLVLRNFAEGEEEEQEESESQTQRGFYSGPALGLGKSVAADQELVRAVVERFLDATPGNICNALPEAVVAAAMRIDKSPGSSAEMQTAPPLLLQSQMESVPLVREYQGCDEYVADILQRLRFNQEYLRACWLSKRQFIRQHQQQQQHSIGIGAAAAAATTAYVSIDEAHAMTAALFYPGAFVRSLVDQFAMAVKRHMAYNLLLTSMASKLVAIADPALSAYLFLANSATVRPPTSSTQPPCALLYDSFVRASADAYVKSERIPRFAARLARQRREGVENAIKVGAAHPQARVSLAAASSSADVLRRSGAPGGDSGIGSNSSSSSRAHEDTARAAEFLGTPIKRFVHGYIVLDEFGKEMAAAAMALHTLELERAMDRLASQRVAPAVAADDDYADILDYFDPEEPAYKRALAVQQTLRTSSRAIIDLGGRSQMGRGSNNSVGSG